MLARVGAAAVFSDRDFAQRQFTAYGPSYWVVIAVFAIGSALLVWIGRSQTESQARRLGRILGMLTAAIYGSMLVYSLIPPTIRAVPLRLTDLATVAAAYALWSQRHWPFALTYYWGLTLSTQALISPVLNSPDFPNYGFLAFWAIHLLVVWAAIYLTWGRSWVMTPAAALVMSDGQREALQGLSRSQTALHRQLQRAKALLLGADDVYVTEPLSGLS